jgi:pimeloyl-ACP methyl ester carboxylesterase
MASDTVAILEATGVASAHIVGHSLGGCIAQQVALPMPLRVKSLSLLCTSARGADIIFPPRCGRALAEAIPGARFLEIRHAAHGVTIELAAVINRMLTEHIRQTT